MEENATIKKPTKKRVKLLRFIQNLALWLNYIAASLLILSYLSPFISPESIWQIAFLGLAFPALIIANLFFVFWWLILWKKKFLISFITIAGGFFIISNHIQLNFSALTADIPEGSTKLLSHNVRLFDLYNWTKNKQTRDKIFDLFTEENADILCLQEIYIDDKKRFATIDSLLKIQKAKNIHIEYTATVDSVHHFGISTLTSFPILRKGKLNFPEQNHNICIYTDILINTDTVRIYNMHLQSIRFHPEEYKYVDDIINNRETEEEIKKSKTILRRLKRAFQKRAAQADIIQNHISQCPYPYIVCGDFNDTPSSYTYNTISKNCKDAFIETGFGLGKTYIGKFPSFRIDYILHSNNIQSFGFRTLPDELSDHHPLSCFIKITK